MVFYEDYMKKVIDNNGTTIEVANDTPVKTINGVHYLLTDSDKATIAAEAAIWEQGAASRASNAILEKRAKEYPAPQAGSDMLWHFLDWMKSNKITDYNSLPTAVIDWYNVCKQVKINNPKV